MGPAKGHAVAAGRFSLHAWALAVFLVLAPVASAEYVTRPLRVDEPIRVDGALDEPAWARATALTEFTQMIPFTGEPITEETEVRILYDDERLYLAYTCYDREMDKSIINDMRRDGSGVRGGDHAFVFIDAYNDRNTAYFFRFNALGGMEDTAVSDGGNTINNSWDAVWECAGSINEDHWTAEVAIPFSQLRFRQADEMTWAINVGRDISRRREISTWSPAPGGYGPLGKYRPAYFGEMTGLVGISAPKHVEALPYVSPGVSRVEGVTDDVFEVGLDAKYGITSNLTADLTLNTDFAQVEADQEQINLTRFSLFFPEKRPFFMEGASRLDFGIPRVVFERPPPMLMFYSRRIGLAGGRAVPVIGGAKVTGKAGTFGVGLLNVVTDRLQDEDIDEPRANSTVLRVTRDVGQGSSVGLIAVNRQDADTYNRGAGFDFSLRPRGNVDIHGLWARTFEESPDPGVRNAYYVGADWTTRLLGADASFSDIGEAFNPGLGFVRRKGLRRARGGFAYTPQPRKHGVRGVSVQPDVDFELTRDNDLATRDVSVEVEGELESGWRLGATARRTAESIDQSFTVFGETIQAGEYHYTTGSVSLDTPSARVASGDVRVDLGEFFDGDRWGGRLRGTIRPTVRLLVSPFVEYNRVTLPEGEFDATLVGGRVAYSFSPRMYARAFSQWNNDTDEVATNLLVNWIYRPGSDLYVVVNQMASASDGLEFHETTALAKLTYWWSR